MDQKETVELMTAFIGTLFDEKFNPVIADLKTKVKNLEKEVNKLKSGITMLAEE